MPRARDYPEHVIAEIERGRHSGWALDQFRGRAIDERHGHRHLHDQVFVCILNELSTKVEKLPIGTFLDHEVLDQNLTL
jgi:hypothetical protein